MAETLTFTSLYRYDTRRYGITLPVLLMLGDRVAEFKGKLDTGASLCVFARLHGEELGLDIEHGSRQEIATVMGNFVAYGHTVRLSVLDLEFDSTVYFAAETGFNRNVLGRQGWLERIKLGLVDYEGKLYLSDYTEATEAG